MSMELQMYSRYESLSSISVAKQCPPNASTSCHLFTNDGRLNCFLLPSFCDTVLL